MLRHVLRPTLILTRPQELADRFALALGDIGADVSVAPMQRISAVPDLPMPSDQEILIVTSGAGAQLAGSMWDLTGFRAYVVGARAATTLSDQGVTILGQAATAPKLIAQIKQDNPAQPLHYLRGQFVSADIENALNMAGIETHSTVIYRQVTLPVPQKLRAALQGDKPLVLPLFSARSSVILGDASAEHGATCDLHLVAISAAVDLSWTGPVPLSRSWAASPDAGAMIEQIRDVVRRLD